MASSKLLCSCLFLAIVAAASPMLLKLHDFSRSVWGTTLPLFATTVQNLNSWLVAACSVPLGYIMLKLWKLFFTPLELKRNLHEIGYMSEEKRSLKDVANEYRKRKKCGDIPPVYPNGWFHVLDSHELEVGDVKYISVLGEHLAVFRGADGVAYIVNAYCPHLGANLGIGGQVVGNCLQCPFHGWVFQGVNGKCAKIPYSDNIPDFAQTKAWPCVEKNSAIYIWYHAEGMEPTWTPDDIEEISNGTWTYRGLTQHTINAHIEESSENGSDVTHLDHLHGSPIISGTDLRYSLSSWWEQFGKHKWYAEWKPLENDEKHVGYLRLTHVLSIFGYIIPYTDFHLTARQTGPGLVFMKWRNFIGDGIFLHSITPKEPLLQIMRHSLYASWTVPTILAKFFLYIEALQLLVWHQMGCRCPA